MGSRSDAVASASLAKGWTQQGVAMVKTIFLLDAKSNSSDFQLEEKNLRELRMQMADGKLQSDCTLESPAYRVMNTRSKMSEEGGVT